MAEKKIRKFYKRVLAAAAVSWLFVWQDAARLKALPHCPRDNGEMRRVRI